MDSIKKGRGRPRYQPTDKDRKQVETLTGLGLTQEEVGAVLGINRKTIMRYFKTELAAGGAKVAAAVLTRLYDKAVTGDDTAAQIFYAKTRRRWSEKVELETTTPEDSRERQFDEVTALMVRDYLGIPENEPISGWLVMATLKREKAKQDKEKEAGLLTAGNGS